MLGSAIASCSPRVLLCSVRPACRITHGPAPRRAVTISALGWPFSGGKDEKPKEAGKNESVLSWARTAKKGTELAPAVAPPGLQLATFAGGCFWGVELAYQRVPGVERTSVGYTAGRVPSPTYEAVCSGFTGHTEAVQVAYDPSQVTYEELLDLFFQRVDPTQKDAQGNDRGTQYRSGIYYHDEEQRQAAEARLKQLQAELDAGRMPAPAGKRWAQKKLAVELQPCGDYWLAEEYHQAYLSKGGRFSSAQSAAKGCKDPIRCYG